MSSPTHPHPRRHIRSLNPERGREAFSSRPLKGGDRDGKAATPRGRRQQRTRRVGRAQPAAPRRKSEPGSRATPASGDRGAEERKRRSPRPGAAELLTHIAGGRRPPSPRAGAHTQLAVFPGRNIHSREDRSSFFAAAPEATESPGQTWEKEQGPAPEAAQEDGLRRHQWSPRSPRVSGGGSHADAQTSLWQARHAPPPPPLPGPPLSAVPSPRAPRTRSRQTRTRRGRRGPGARGAEGRTPLCAGVQAHLLGWRSRLPQPRASSCSPLIVTLSKGKAAEADRRRSRGES